ncbi:helix-turn-helix domain-containing protein [Thalassotalea piscium]|uniref:Transcriptional regulator with XRE-family HTH domain n=1 Tax=Thalassotalea piscium TaxID=1230533 RepID=A0A7X0NHS5_9GAMM|nr:helix-turn-helix domain-containing protein [Thalassotalea piscium]MBB6543678.1 transcriptional regulator with XRE-family HTH domain [Thalassotalea piscium]
MIIRKIRLQRGWSQEQLAELSGLSVRTIQRIERGQSAGLESLKSLAAVFEVQVADLQPELAMNTTSKLTIEEEQAIEYVRDLKGFYSHLTTYVIVIACLFIFNLTFTPSYLWVLWAAFGWGIGVVSHAISVFEVFSFFGADWEKKQIEKKLGRKL